MTYNLESTKKKPMKKEETSSGVSSGDDEKTPKKTGSFFFFWSKLKMDKKTSFFKKSFNFTTSLRVLMSQKIDK